MPLGSFRINTLSLGSSVAPALPETFYLTRLGSASAGAETAYDLAVDSTGNVYATGTYFVGTTQYVAVTKIDPSGTHVWFRYFGQASSPFGIALDSDGNPVISGFMSATSGTTAGGLDILTVKFNGANGAITWQRRVGLTGTEVGQGIGIDSSGNSYQVGYGVAGAGGNDIVVVKRNSSGTLQWVRSWGGTGADQVTIPGTSISVTPSGTFYVTGQTASPTTNGGNDVWFARMDSNGNDNLQKGWGSTGTSDNEFGTTIAYDSDGNMFVGGYTSTSGNDMIIGKFNSSGVKQWDRRIAATLASDIIYGIAVDSTNRIFMCGQVGTSPTRGFVAEIGQTGTVVWQRVFYNTSATIFRSIRVTDGALYITGNGGLNGGHAGSEDLVLIKVPKDGSKTGTYSLNGTNWVYAASAFTFATNWSDQDYTRSFSGTNRTWTEGTPTMTTTTPSLGTNDLRQYITIIP